MEENMLRKITIALTAVAALGAMAIPTDVLARGGHGGVRVGGHYSGGHFNGGTYRFGSYGSYRGSGFRYVAPAYGYSCWQFRATPYGLRRVYVCDAGYPYY
jgi:hypothetical protein